MGTKIIDDLCWEHNENENLIDFVKEITESNLDEIPIELISELRILRDDDYNIKVVCSSRHTQDNNVRTKRMAEDSKPGSFIDGGKISLKLLNNLKLELSPCFYEGCRLSEEKTEYYLKCYHIDAIDESKEVKGIREWIINGDNQQGLIIYGNESYDYKTESATTVTWGDMKFDSKEPFIDKICHGRYTHIIFRDTGFDICYTGTGYGPEWSTNLSIAYFEKYGRIPNEEERTIIREYLSFFMGKKLIYIGESRYDADGGVIGFEMEMPNTYGFDIKKLCGSCAKPPISNCFNRINDYVNTLQQHIDCFAELYVKLDLGSFFSIYWYAREIIEPFNLPMLSSALEHLKRCWYGEISGNPETVLIDKKEFKELIKPVIEIVKEQFKDTAYAERMEQSIRNINRMSVSEQLENFFESIGMLVGVKEQEAMKARNLPAHGTFGGDIEDYKNQIKLSEVYERILNRCILKLINYDGNYIDYGVEGYPEKILNSPSGDELKKE